MASAAIGVGWGDGGDKESGKCGDREREGRGGGVGGEAGKEGREGRILKRPDHLTSLGTPNVNSR